MIAANTHQPPNLAQDFVRYLTTLTEQDRGAKAALRHSLGFAPGRYPAAFPYVERFVGNDRHTDDAWRKALYLVAGLFSAHPAYQADRSFATAFARLRLQRNSDSIEKRFITLIAADPENIPNYLRQAVSLMAAEGIAFDYAALCNHLARWLNPWAQEQRDDLRQRWARDYYRALAPHEYSETPISKPTPFSE